MRRNSYRENDGFKCTEYRDEIDNLYGEMYDRIEAAKKILIPPLARLQRVEKSSSFLNDRSHVWSIVAAALVQLDETEEIIASRI